MSPYEELNIVKSSHKIVQQIPNENLQTAASQCHLLVQSEVTKAIAD